MRCGSRRRALTGGGGRAEPAVFGGWGARRFLVDICGLAESLVPAYTNSSIFCEKLRSGDAEERDRVSGERGIFCPGAGERDSVSGERGSSSDVSGDCNVLSWHPRLFSRKLSLGSLQNPPPSRSDSWSSTWASPWSWRRSVRSGSMKFLDERWIQNVPGGYP